MKEEPSASRASAVYCLACIGSAATGIVAAFACRVRIAWIARRKSFFLNFVGALSRIVVADVVNFGCFDFVWALSRIIVTRVVDSCRLWFTCLGVFLAQFIRYAFWVIEARVKLCLCRDCKSSDGEQCHSEYSHIIN